MRDRGNTFKIFIGNLSDRTSGQDLRDLFEEHGTVTEADVVEGKNFGFVHMESEEDRKAAVDALNGHSLHDREIAVEISTQRKTGRGSQKTKIFVGNLHKDTTSEEIRELFEEHGTVSEADVVSNFGFVHMENADDARKAIKSVDGTELHGLRLRVQESTSRRPEDGMGDKDACFNCGRRGHFSRECRSGGGDRGGRGGRGGGRFDPYGGPPMRGYERDRMMRDDRYSPYRDDPYARRSLPPMRDDPYDRRPLPPMRSDPYDRLPLPRMREDPYERRPLPPLRDDPYDRRPSPAGMDYMRYGRRSRSPPRSMGMDRGYDRYPPPPPRRF